MDQLKTLTQDVSADSENAFTKLVRDHADLVYSAARRQLGNCGMVEDVMQAVFILLWRKAALIKGPVAGWLVKATYLTCLDARKLAARRQFHEQMAATMKPEESNQSPESEWESYAPILDEAMAQLNEKDRDIIALRYLRGLAFKEVALAMGTQEDAAKKRVERAIERLRSTLSQKTTIPAASVLATQLGLHCIETAPSPLVTKIIASAGSAVKGSVAGTLIQRMAARSGWLLAKLAGAAIVLLGLGAWTAYITLLAGPGGDQNTNASNTPAPDGIQPISLNIRANIDGSDYLTITSAGASWTHQAFQMPTWITINGSRFDPTTLSPLSNLNLQNADLSTAKVISRHGRGTIAMEIIDDGIRIHFADPSAGAAPYQMQIEFAPKSSNPPAAPALAASTLPSTDSITLEIKATLNYSSEEISITPQNIKWRHVIMGWPSDVTINGQPWDIQSQPTWGNNELANADLSTAQLIDHTGKDTAVMEKTDNGFTIYLGDAIEGPSPYEVKIRFAKKK